MPSLPERLRVCTRCRGVLARAVEQQHRTCAACADLTLWQIDTLRHLIRVAGANLGYPPLRYRADEMIQPGTVAWAIFSEGAGALDLELALEAAGHIHIYRAVANLEHALECLEEAAAQLPTASQPGMRSTTPRSP